MPEERQRGRTAVGPSPVWIAVGCQHTGWRRALPSGPSAEPIHQHVSWTLDTAGVDEFKVTASTDRSRVAEAGTVTYQFTVQ